MPGEFADVVCRAIHRYQDPDIRTKLREEQEAASEQLQHAWRQIAEPYSDELSHIEGSVNAIYERYRRPLAALSQELDAELEPINARLRILEGECREEMMAFDFEIPEKPAGCPAGPENVDPLYDSARPHLEQLEAFKRHNQEVAS